MASITTKPIFSLYQTLFKEQSPCPSVLLDQTKPEGFSPRVKSDPTKHKSEGIVPILNTCMFTFDIRKYNDWLITVNVTSCQSLLPHQSPCPIAKRFCWLTKPGNTVISLGEKIGRVRIGIKAMPNGATDRPSKHNCFYPAITMTEITDRIFRFNPIHVSLNKCTFCFIQEKLESS